MQNNQMNPSIYNMNFQTISTPTQLIWPCYSSNAFQLQSSNNIQAAYLLPYSVVISPSISPSFSDVCSQSTFFMHERNNLFYDQYHDDAHVENIPQNTGTQKNILKIEENVQNSNIISFNEENAELKPIISNLQKISKSRKPKINKKIQQAEYNPKKRQNEKPKKSKHINQNRNIITNQINQILNFISTKKKSGRLVQKLFKKFPPENLSYNINRFYIYQQILKKQISHYSTLTKLKIIDEIHQPECQIWQRSQQMYYIKISRMLVHHFLHQDSICFILTSKKMKSSKKIDHLKAVRTILESMNQLFSKI